jgi:hypothetical protein
MRVKLKCGNEVEVEVLPVPEQEDSQVCVQVSLSLVVTLGCGPEPITQEVLMEHFMERFGYESRDAFDHVEIIEYADDENGYDIEGPDYAAVLEQQKRERAAKAQKVRG